MQKIFSVIIFYVTCFLAGTAVAQQCSNCKFLPSVTMFDLDVQTPDESEDTKSALMSFARYALNKVYEDNKKCIQFSGAPRPLEGEAQLLPLEKNPVFATYLITGYIKKEGSDYKINIQLQTSCSRKPVAAGEQTFQLPGDTNAIQDKVAQAAEGLSDLSEKIKQFELNQRKQNKKVALEGGFGEAITIKPQKNILVAGEQTNIEITLKDCDGQPLAEKEIIFTEGTLNDKIVSPGTKGGIVTPAKVVTDAGGKAKATFKMGSGKSALISAHHVYESPYGCKGVKLGSAPINNIPIKVEISYFENITQTLKRATLPGIEIDGGDETEITTAAHTSVFYHYPSPSALKQGFIIYVDNEDGDEDSKTEYITDDGYLEYQKKISKAEVKGKVKSVTLVQATEEGESQQFTALPKFPSSVSLTKRRGFDSAQFTWDAVYLAKSKGEEFEVISVMTINEAEEGVKWITNKITDPKSPYKTEYLISLTVNAAEELKKGNKAMKDWLGADLNDMANILDPTKPKRDIATATGSKTITVRILSPYSEN